jgi:hypothetical protein
MLCCLSPWYCFFTEASHLKWSNFNGSQSLPMKRCNGDSSNAGARAKARLGVTDSFGLIDFDPKPADVEVKDYQDSWGKSAKDLRKKKKVKEAAEKEAAKAKQLADEGSGSD